MSEQNIRKETLLNILKQTSQDLRELCGARVDEVQAPVDPLSFYRQYVAANKPCIIKGGVDDWPARHLWTIGYLKRRLGEHKIPVAVTPNGRADAVTKLENGERVFALPLCTELPLATFLDYVTSPASREGNRAYMQQQNDCLRNEFSALYQDIQPGLPWAEKVFGWEPEAVNLWLGTSESETSFHKDHYENLFVVLQGSKTFTLLPPSDIFRLGMQDYSVADYQSLSKTDNVETTSVLHRKDLELEACQPASTVKWSPIEPSCEESDKSEFPLFFDASLPKPLKIEIGPGDILYLPSLWHHHVRQANEQGNICIGVNFWYDMQMSANYANFCLSEKLAQCL